MGVGRTIALGAFSAVVLLNAVPAIAAPREPLIVTRLADPDPLYVDGLKSRSGKSQEATLEADSKIEEAMQRFGRAIGEAAILEQQQIEALCRAGEPTNAKAEQRFDFEASCRYSRH
jgi:hypothetical protein